MEHLTDIIIILAIVIGAAFYLFKTFKKAKNGCGSICSGCSGSCNTKVKSFSGKSIPIKQIN